MLAAFLESLEVAFGWNNGEENLEMLPRRPHKSCTDR